MKYLSLEDLDDLSIGAAVLGSGGGGNPSYELMMAKQQFEDFGSPQIVSLEDLDDEALVAPVAFMGAPLVGMEKIPSGDEFAKILELIEKVKGKKVTHLVAGEIGGANAFTPLIVGARFNLPVIDGDLLGRAFPELQMSACTLKGINASPAFMTDALLNRLMIEGNTGEDIERYCRKITIEMGSSAAISLYLMTGKECKEALISGTLTQACEIGKSIRFAKQNDLDLEDLLKFTGGVKIGSGIIRDVDQKIKEGFLKGSFKVSNEESLFEVHYQNEYLLVTQEDVPIFSTPDIIVVLEQETLLPITSESLAYGIRVDLLMLPSPAIWKTSEGLKLVGPDYFGFNKIKEKVSCQN